MPKQQGSDPLRESPDFSQQSKESFPDADLYFKVYSSEEQEPESRYRKDVIKLYDRWQKKYGRRWPENGLNTEDLVWLNEGSGNADDGNAADGGQAAAQAAASPEQPLYPGEMMEAPLEGELNAAGVTGKDREEMLKNGSWVTDEFESEEYEKGNMELLHGLYLWDREGNPTIMPAEPPKEELGEESEDWDDFYASHRPRHVNSDDVKDAVWATDEFESDEDNTESEWEPEYVGAGLGLRTEDPIHPQWALRHTNHPLAPFPGEGLKWSSFVYDDGTTYEGLTREAIMHGMGVMIFGNGTGGGFHLREVRRGDQYEGEFQAGFAHGLGQFTSPSRGEIYLGEFFAGQRHGCGLKVDMSPFYYLVERGADPVKAYQQTSQRIMRDMEFRTWYRNQPLGSDNEAETVLYSVREDFDNPWNTITRTAAHETSLREWQAKSPAERGASKMADILMKLSGGLGGGAAAAGDGGGFQMDLDGRVEGEGGDSVELMLGNTTEGGVGFGWQDETDSEAYPTADRQREALINDAVDDAQDESDDKEAVLGEDILNPFTGLGMKDYLEGREDRYNSLMQSAVGAKPAQSSSEQQQKPKAKRSPNRPGVLEEAALLKNFQDAEKAWGEQGGRVGPRGDRNWASDDTDTRFETESDIMELCDLNEILGTIDEVEEVVTKARMWRWKPYGEVSLRFAQDASGAPLALLQDALHYPHGTKWMAPGPLGQVHPLPPDPAVKKELLRVAKNYQHLHSLYNFDWDPQPGSDQWLVDQRILRALDLNDSRMQHVADVLNEPEEGDAEGQGVGQPALAAATLASAAAPKRRPVASNFASMSLGMGRPSRAVLDVLSNAAKHAVRRPRLARPSKRSNSSSGTATPSL